MLVIGSSILELSYGPILLKQLEVIAGETDASWYMVNPYGNLFGLLSTVPTYTHREVFQLIQEGKIDLLYLIGSVPFAKTPGVKCVISQTPYPGPGDLIADIQLPATTWVEVGGTLLGVDFKKNKYKAVAEPPGKVLTHREVFEQIARAGGNSTPFDSKALAQFATGEPLLLYPENRGEPDPPLKPDPPGDKFPYTLVYEALAHNYLDTNISSLSDGMRTIVPENTLIINPKDAEELQLSSGDTVLVQTPGATKEFPVIIRRTVVPRHLHLVPSPGAISFETNPVPVNLVPTRSVAVDSQANPRRRQHVQSNPE